MTALLLKRDKIKPKSSAELPLTGETQTLGQLFEHRNTDEVIEMIFRLCLTEELSSHYSLDSSFVVEFRIKREKGGPQFEELNKNSTPPHIYYKNHHYKTYFFCSLYLCSSAQRT